MDTNSQHPVAPIFIHNHSNRRTELPAPQENTSSTSKSNSLLVPQRQTAAISQKPSHSFLTQRFLKETHFSSTHPPSWIFEDKEAQIENLTAEQVKALFPMIFEMEPKEQTDFIKKLSPAQLFLLSPEQLLPIVPQLRKDFLFELKKEDLEKLRSIFSQATSDDVAIIFPKVLTMDVDDRGVFVRELLQPHHFSLLSSKYLSPILFQMTYPQVKTLEPLRLSQIESEDLLQFMHVGKWTHSDHMVEPFYSLTIEQFQALWPIFLKLEPVDRAFFLDAVPSYYFPWMSAEEIGPVLGALNRNQIRQLRSKQVQELLPWISKMEKWKKVLFAGCLQPLQLNHCSITDRIFLQDDFTLEEINNINMEESGPSTIALLQPRHIKALWSKILRKIYHSGPLLRSDQLALLGENEFKQLLSSDSLIKFLFFTTPEDMEILWPTIFSLESKLKSAFISHLLPYHFLPLIISNSSLKIDKLLPILSDLRPIQIRDLLNFVPKWQQEKEKSVFIKTLIPHLRSDQLTRLDAEQIVPLLESMKSEQIQGLTYPIKIQLRLNIAFNENRFITDFDRKQLNAIFPAILQLTPNIRTAYLKQLPPQQFAQLNSENIRNLLRVSNQNVLPLMLGKLTPKQIQALNSRFIEDLWPLVKKETSNENILRFVNSLLPQQLTRIPPTQRPLIINEGTSEELKKVKIEELSEMQTAFLRSDQIRKFFPNILKVEKNSAIVFLKQLHPDQLNFNGEELLLLQNAEIGSEIWSPAQLQKLWSAALGMKNQERKQFIHGVSLKELEKGVFFLGETDLVLLAQSDVSFEELDPKWVKDLMEIIYVRIQGSARKAFINKLPQLPIADYQSVSGKYTQALLCVIPWKNDLWEKDLLELAPELSPQYVKRFFSEILKKGTEFTIDLLARLHPHQLSLLDAQDLFPALGKLTSEQIKNLSLDHLKELAPRISEMEALEKRYFIHQLLPQQSHYLASMGFFSAEDLSDKELDQLNKISPLQLKLFLRMLIQKPELFIRLWSQQILKMKGKERTAFIQALGCDPLSILKAKDLVPIFGELHSTQIQALDRNVIQELQPHILAMEKVKRGLFAKQLHPSHLALLGVAGLALVLEDLTPEQIRGLDSKVVAELLFSLHKKSKDTRINFLSYVKPAQLSLAKAQDLGPLLEDLTQEQLQGLSQLEDFVPYLSKLEPLDRIYFFHCLLAQQRDEFTALGVTISNDLSQDDIAKMRWEEAPAHQLRLLSAESIKKILPTILKMENSKKFVFIKQLQGNQLFLLNAKEVLSVAPALTPEQFQAMFDRMLSMESGIFNHLHRHQFSLLLPEELAQVLNQIPPEMLKTLIKSRTQFLEIWPIIMKTDPVRRKALIKAFLEFGWFRFLDIKEIGPLFNAMEPEMLLQFDKSSIFPKEFCLWLARMENSKKEAFFQLFHSNALSHMVRILWPGIPTLNEPDRTSLLQSMLRHLNPGQIKKLLPWISSLKPTERRLFMEHLQADPLTLLSKEELVSVGYSMTFTDVRHLEELWEQKNHFSP